MVEKSAVYKDHRSLAQGFGICTVAVLLLYFLSGMNAVKMREIHLSLLMAILTASCVFYVTCAFVKSYKRFVSLVSFIPALGIYYLIFKLSFDACDRKTLPALSVMEGVLFWAGIGTVLVSVLVLFAGHKLEDGDLVTAVLASGFVLRTVMVLFTPLNFYQHDVSSFSPDQAGFHDSYILYVYENLTLPDGDVRDLGQFYHPPLHYFLSALLLRLHNALPWRFSGDVNGLKMLPMLWTSYLILFGKKILEHFEIKGKALAFSLMLIVFCPQMVFLSIQVNNDAVALMFFIASLYLGFKWYSKPEMTTVLFLAITIGCAMMSKLSMGFVAFPVAWLFLARLIRAVKEKKSKKGGIKVADLIKQFAGFAVLVFPLGLWFPLRNLICYGTPITYVYVIDPTAGQGVWMYSTWQRLFAPSKAILGTPFLHEGGEFSDYNIFLGILKSGLFDERFFESQYLTAVARVMLCLAFVLMVAVTFIAVAGTLKSLRKTGGKFIDATENAALLILVVVLTVSEIVFCFNYPVVCTEAFRYIAPVLIPAACWTGRYIGQCGEKGTDTFRKVSSGAFMVLTAMFVLTVILFYGPFIQYQLPWETLIR